MKEKDFLTNQTTQIKSKGSVAYSAALTKEIRYERNIPIF